MFLTEGSKKSSVSIGKTSVIDNYPFCFARTNLQLFRTIDMKTLCILMHRPFKVKYTILIKVKQFYIKA